MKFNENCIHTGNESSTIPLFVSYPRCGSVWIQAMAEIYFQRPRGPSQAGGVTWIEHTKDEKFMWFHTHDKRLKTLCSTTQFGDIFLFRNPVDAIYSRTRVPRCQDITTEATKYKELFEKWIVTAKTVIVYEHTVSCPLQTLKLLSNHFEVDWNQERADLAVDTCSKVAVMTKANTRYHNDKVLKTQYGKDRVQFRKSHKKEILDIVLTDKTEKWLTGIV